MVIVFTNHAALKHLMKKSNPKPRLIRWILLLQEFDLEIKDKVGLANVVANHLSRLGSEATPSEELPINDSSSMSSYSLYPNKLFLLVC